MKKTLFTSACCAALALGVSAYGDSFWFEEVGPKPIDSGLELAMAVLPVGQPAISWIRWSEGGYELWYAEFDGSQWAKTRVRAIPHPEAISSVDLVILPSGEPAISFGCGSSVWYASRVDGGWSFEAVTGLEWTGPCGTTSLALLNDGSPAIAFAAAGTYTLATHTLYAHRIAPGVWFLADIDWGWQSADSWATLAVLPSGEPAVAYCRVGAAVPPHYLLAYAPGPTFGSMPTDAGDYQFHTGLACDLAIFPSGLPAVSYVKNAVGEGPSLRYAEFDGATWHIETHFGAPGGLRAIETERTRLVVVDQNEPMIACTSGDQVAFTWRDNYGRWQTITWPYYPAGIPTMQRLPSGDVAVVYAGPTPPPWGNSGFIYMVGHRVPTGACCNGLVCTEPVTEPDCTAGGGVYKGDDSTCTPDLCLPNGACCQADGSCAVTTEAACTGTWRGAGTNCTPNLCPQPGACCQPDGSCTVTTQAACTGTWRGAGTNCAPNLCPQPGACCQPDGSCAVTTQAACTGVWRGAGTNCTPNLCPQPGACCYPDGSCAVTTQAACTGVWRGAGTNCTPNLCPQPGACCQPDGSCAVTTQAACTGTWRGAGTNCAPNLCPQPGACCQPDGSCAVTTQAACTGTWHSEWTTCQPNPCPPHNFLRGDLNCDGSVDFGDINPFVQYLSNFAAWQATYPDCPPQNGDANGDGTYGQGSFGDINPFVQCVILGYCP